MVDRLGCCAVRDIEFVIRDIEFVSLDTAVPAQQVKTHGAQRHSTPTFSLVYG
jgi:hypothetical protein